MNSLFSLSLSYLRFRPLHTALTILLLALGVATMAALWLMSTAIQERSLRDGAGIDLVVGAKGSPVQLILSSVYHADIPTGNIPFSEMEKLRGNRLVKSVTPLALGDAFHGYRVVGTDLSYPQHYRAALSEGTWFAKPFDAVLGSDVARAGNLASGATFFSNHGLIGDGDVHKDFHYTVTGTMAPTGTVLDRLILTPVESIWKAHAGHDHDHEEGKHEEHSEHEEHEEHADHDETHGENHDDDREITALLVRFSSPAAAINLPRMINKQSGVQAAAPAQEMARLLAMVGIGVDVVRGFGMLLVIAALLSLFIALYQAMEQRRWDLAVMRSLGARPATILRLVLIEGGIIALCGALAGLIFAYSTLAFLGSHLTANGLQLSTSPAMPAMLILLVTLAGMAAALLPAWRAYRLDVARTLSVGK